MPTMGEIQEMRDEILKLRHDLTNVQQQVKDLVKLLSLSQSNQPTEQKPDGTVKSLKRYPGN